MLAMYDSMSKRRGIRWPSWLSHCAASRKVADESNGQKNKTKNTKIIIIIIIIIMTHNTYPSARCVSKAKSIKSDEDIFRKIITVLKHSFF